MVIKFPCRLQVQGELLAASDGADGWRREAEKLGAALGAERKAASEVRRWADAAEATAAGLRVRLSERDEKVLLKPLGLQDCIHLQATRLTCRLHQCCQCCRSILAVHVRK